jgi:archaellum component FlaF (FlaF/FlaG flagellin family)
MNIITLIAILISLSLIYSMIQSHNNMEKELREIRMKCIMPTRSDSSISSSTPSTSSTPSYNVQTNNPYSILKSSMVSTLTNLLPRT